MIRRPPNSPLFPYTTLSRSSAYPDHLARLTLTRPRKRRRRQPRSLGARAQPGRGLRVIHIMYTVWGDHTTYRANGQERSEEHTSELQSQSNLVCRLLLEKKT